MHLSKPAEWTILTVNPNVNYGLELIILCQYWFISDYKYTTGQAQWLTPVIPALWEAEVGRSHEVRSLRPAWPTW